MPLTRTRIVDRAAEYASSVLADEGHQLRPIIIMAIGAAWDAQPRKAGIGKALVKKSAMLPSVGISYGPRAYVRI